VDLQFQFQWRGASLVNTYILVCKRCLDVPTEQLRAIRLPADPVPVFYPSVEPFCLDETNFLAVTAPPLIDPVTGIQIPTNNLRTTTNNLNRTVDPYGAPIGLTQNAVMPYNGALQKAFGVKLQLLSVVGNGTTIVTVTCSAPHGLATNGQIAAAGLSYLDANGFFSVTVLSATAFTYMTYGAIPTGSLLESGSLIITALVGLPCDYVQIPLINGGPLSITVQSYLLELQNGVDLFLLEDGTDFIELEAGP
jgi:hypothetical protein